MKKMVITGVNGFIGRHAKEYFEKEYEITGLDLAANYCGDRQPGDTMTYYQCNMSQESAEMAAIFTGVQPDVILHCAGSANVGGFGGQSDGGSRRQSAQSLSTASGIEVI